MFFIVAQELMIKKNMPLILDVVNGKLQTHYGEDNLNLTINRYTIVFSVNITLLVMEFLSFISGISMFLTWQNQTSMICHIGGVCSLFSLMYLNWSEQLFLCHFYYVQCYLL
ncbi:transmembrane protein 107 [Caerostris extrusa]|uniref:Transmembrane protein 107 n=1 Tax=Caerostris extrusa TaxID=172846 RepID=A0AAV4VL97_CAEEX|nr:transmembrane protein 107 [Caerostris extrusa]